MLKETSDYDKQLVEEIKRGSHQAFKQLFERYWDRLYAVALNRLGSAAEAEDLIQQLFMDIWFRKESIEIKHSISAYLHSALKYLIIGHIKQQSRRKKYVDLITRQYYESNYLDTETQFSYKELNDKLEEQVEQLPDRCKEVFKLSRYEHYSHKEVANELGISYKTVENHIGKAIKLIRPSLEKMISILLIVLPISM